MDAIALIDKYYADTPRLRNFYGFIAAQVADRCLKIAVLHPELGLDKAFLEEAALLHDIGILHTHAPGILCTGDAPYICHGYLGAEMLRAEGFRVTPGCASVIPVRGFRAKKLQRRVCLYLCRIIIRRLWRNSSSVMRINLFQIPSQRGKTPEQALKSVSKYGEDGARRFRHWMELFTENLGH